MRCKNNETLSNFDRRVLKCGYTIFKLTSGGGKVVELFAVHQVFNRHTPANTSHNIVWQRCETRTTDNLEWMGSFCKRRGQGDCVSFADAASDWCDAFDDLSGNQFVACDHRIAQTYFDRREATCGGEFVHLAFMGVTSLNDAETSHCATWRVICAHRIADNSCVRTAIRPLNMGDAVD